MTTIKHSQEDWDRHFLAIAELCSQMSKDPSTKVGAAIKGPDKRVLGTGYNGFPPSIPDDGDKLCDRPTKYKYIIHAEENAIKFAGNLPFGSTIYTTLFPCDNCYKLIRDAGITRIVTRIPTQEHIERWGEKFKKVKEMSKENRIQIDYVKND